jgi:hypothetical protein
MDRTERKGRPGHNSRDRTAATGALGPRVLVPEAGTGLARLGSRDRTARTGQPGQDSWTGRQEKTVGIINQDRKKDKTVKKSQ